MNDLPINQVYIDEVMDNARQGSDIFSGFDRQKRQHFKGGDEAALITA